MMEDLGWTPLHCMVEKENVTVIKELLRQGANVSAHDNFNRTPLSIAACKGNLEIVKLLLEEGPNSNDGYPLHYACESGHAELAQHLIKNGADVNLGRDDNYPLLIAAARGHLEATKVLIDNGADVHVVDENKETALHWACDNGSEDIISLLIDAGCDVNITDRYSMTPLSICLIRKENEPELVRLLLQKGASANVADDQGCTYLHSVENVESALELVKYGADINAQNVYKETPLYNLSFYGHFDCAKALLQNGADPNIVANGGWTPLHIAAAEDNLDFVEELIKWKVDVNAASSRNIIPLHLAALNGHLQIVTKLLENGSLIDMPIIDLPDINYSVPHFVKRDSISDGFTPLAIAASNQHVEVCKLLVSHGADCDGISSLPLEIVELKSTKKMRDWPCNDILELVRSNNLSEIKNVSDVDCRSATDLVGWSALHHSVAKNLYEMSCELINKGVSVNSLDKYRRTPLSVAAARNNVRMLRLLIDNGADVNLGLALHYAAE
jgi:ankyrin repeat protein